MQGSVRLAAMSVRGTLLSEIAAAKIYIAVLNTLMRPMLSVLRLL